MWGLNLCFLSSTFSLSEDLASPSQTSISMHLQPWSRTFQVGMLDPNSPSRALQSSMEAHLYSRILRGKMKVGTYMLISISAGDAVELITRQIGIVATINKIARQRVAEVCGSCKI